MVGKILFWLVFGPALAAAYVPLVILLGGKLANPPVGLVGFLVNMIGREQEITRGIAIAAGINILLDLFLIISLGMRGGRQGHGSFDGRLQRFALVGSE